MKGFLIHIAKMLGVLVAMLVVFVLLLFATNAGDGWEAWTARGFLLVMMLSSIVSFGEWMEKR